MNVIWNTGQGGSTVPCRDRAGQPYHDVTEPWVHTHHLRHNQLGVAAAFVERQCCAGTLLMDRCFDYSIREGWFRRGGGGGGANSIDPFNGYANILPNHVYIFRRLPKDLFPGPQTAILATVRSRTIGQSIKVHVADLFFISSIVNWGHDVSWD